MLLILPLADVEEGREMSVSGLAKRASSCEACAETGVRARRLRGRWERRSYDVGIDSGIGSDILAAKPHEASVEEKLVVKVKESIEVSHGKSDT